jgi:EmrB/QacA subfamily drug resistance transporter
VAFAGLMLGMLLSALDQTIVATALPTIAGDVGGLAQLSWVVTAYLLAWTALTPLWGKLGDLYGRRGVYLVAIALFLVGSALAGLSESMPMLIACRAIQGAGGGGLIVTAQGLIADVVPPRERGRYQGMFGAVFGVSSVVGPLLGGLFVDHLSWRWVFYVNLPVGVAAMVVTAIALPAVHRRVAARIDYAGTVLVAGGLVALVALVSLGGSSFPWRSWPSFSLAAAATLLLALFVMVEARAPEPVLPLHLFRNRAFVATAAVGFVVGVALLGTVTYLPLFLQVVSAAGPTESGLRMLPMMAGVLVAATVSGRLITRWGRYRPFPLAGTAVMAVGLFLLSRMDRHTGMLGQSIAMAVLGTGLGLVMQVLVIAVQSAIEYRLLGVATSGLTLFRSIGGAVGAAAFGGLFANVLSSRLAGVTGVGAAAGGRIAPDVVQGLPAGVRAAVQDAYAHSLDTVFLAAVPLALVAFALAWLIPQVTLRETARAADPGDAYAIPRLRDSDDELERALSVLTDRDRRRGLHRALSEGLPGGEEEMSDPARAWLLYRMSRGPVTLDGLAAELRLPMGMLAPTLQEMLAAGLIEPGGDVGPAVVITADGRRAFEALIEPRRRRLQEMTADWTLPPEVWNVLRRLAIRMLAEDVRDSVIASHRSRPAPAAVAT